jgi:hypothetical protein
MKQKHQAHSGFDEGAIFRAEPNTVLSAENWGDEAIVLLIQQDYVHFTATSFQNQWRTSSMIFCDIFIAEN